MYTIIAYDTAKCELCGQTHRIPIVSVKRNIKADDGSIRTIDAIAYRCEIYAKNFTPPELKRINDRRQAREAGRHIG